MDRQRKILVVANACCPEISPRAFRVTELVRELAREGHEVTLLLPNRDIYRRHPFDNGRVRVVYADGPVRKAESAGGRRLLRRLLPKFVQRAILYFYCHELFVKYDRGLYRRLLQFEGPFDAVVSVSYPASIHLAVSRAMGRNDALARAVCIAEFSDPPFRGDAGRKVFPAYFLYLRRWGRQFDYFSIPVEKARACYRRYMEACRIRIVPQGFDLDAVKRKPYVPHARPAFAYAGRFYEHIRDPRFFFDFLRTFDGDFRFDLYLNHVDPVFAEMIREAQAAVGGRIVLHEALPRERLIGELAAADFLVNFDNTTSHATPSKLIDYALARRPILSFNERTFRPEAFRAAMKGDYSGCMAEIDLSPYDIRRVAGQFLQMIEEGKKTR